MAIKQLTARISTCFIHRLNIVCSRNDCNMNICVRRVVRENPIIISRTGTCSGLGSDRGRQLDFPKAPRFELLISDLEKLSIAKRKFLKLPTDRMQIGLATFRTHQSFVRSASFGRFFSRLTYSCDLTIFK